MITITPVMYVSWFSTLKVFFISAVVNEGCHELTYLMRFIKTYHMFAGEIFFRDIFGSIDKQFRELHIIDGNRLLLYPSLPGSAPRTCPRFGDQI